MNKNCFEEIFRLLEEFESSEIPAERLFYLKSVKKMIAIGEKLNQLKPNTETQKRINELKEEIKDYSLYPKLKTVSE